MVSRINKHSSKVFPEIGVRYILVSSLRSCNPVSLLNRSAGERRLISIREVEMYGGEILSGV